MGGRSAATVLALFQVLGCLHLHAALKIKRATLLEDDFIPDSSCPLPAWQQLCAWMLHSNLMSCAACLQMSCCDGLQRQLGNLRPSRKVTFTYTPETWLDHTDKVPASTICVCVCACSLGCAYLHALAAKRAGMRGKFKGNRIFGFARFDFEHHEFHTRGDYKKPPHIFFSKGKIPSVAFFLVFCLILRVAFRKDCLLMRIFLRLICLGKLFLER